jgi:hypothetical protein
LAAAALNGQEEEDTFPGTTFSFFLVAMYPFCNSIIYDADSEKDSDAPDEDLQSKNSLSPSIDWNSREVLVGALVFPLPSRNLLARICERG